jgi:hypothetical protein
MTGASVPMLSSSLGSPRARAVAEDRVAARVEHADAAALVREPWVTKRELAEHLHVAIRWIEGQHHHGLPYARRGGVLRYRISEVERWLRGEQEQEQGGM